MTRHPPASNTRGYCSPAGKTRHTLVDSVDIVGTDQGLLRFIRELNFGAFTLDHGQQPGRIALEDKIAGAVLKQREREIH
jgi:hypothetical protein